MDTDQFVDRFPRQSFLTLNKANLYSRIRATLNKENVYGTSASLAPRASPAARMRSQPAERNKY